jgi:glycosyltransferase involved in cell wall biosynthesis
MRIVVDLQGAQSENRFRGIGQYSLALAKALLNVGQNHELWIALNGEFQETIEPIRATFDHLLPQNRIVVFSLPGPVAEADAVNCWRARCAEHIREHFLASLRPDATILSSLFEGQASDAATSVGRFVRSGLSSVTLYDLIPLRYYGKYLSDSTIREWYFRKLDSLKRTDVLLAISESCRQDAIHALSIADDRIINILGDVDDRFRRLEMTPDEICEIRAKFGLHKPFIMYTGGINYLDNTEGLIEAYALCPSQLRQAHRLAIVGSIQQADRQRLDAMTTHLGLGKDEIIFTGSVSDNEMIALYNLCALVVFPSVYAGFGLPVLEAMRCGAAVIGSESSSIPEVVGRSDALFDPTRPQAIAGKITEVLTNRGFYQSLCDYSPKQSKKFSWNETARRALAALEEAHARLHKGERVFTSVSLYRPKMAYISPLPPERTGIADYNAELLPELSRHYDIEVVVDQKEVSAPWIRANFPIRSPEWFDRHASRFDRIVYHLGNSPFHSYQFDLLEKHRGVVDLHDFFLGHAISHASEFGGRPGWLEESLFESHGYGALMALSQDRDIAIWTYPANKPVLDEAAGVIAHSQTVRKWAEVYYGTSYMTNWQVVPHLRRMPPSINRRLARDELALDDSVFLVCSFGLLGPTKHNHSLLEAWLASPLSRDQRCRLVFVGENHPDEYGLQLARRIKESGLSDRITITGWANPQLFSNYLSSADMAVQLRSSSRGESSGTILDCLAHGLPLVINAHGPAAEFPEGVVAKLPDQFFVEDLASVITDLWHNEADRQSLARSAVSFIRERHAPAMVGELYRDAIESVYAQGSFSLYHQLITKLSCLDTGNTLASSRDLIQVAQAIDANQPRRSVPQLLIDVSELARKDIKTGIQRVCRSVLLDLITHAPADWRVESIGFDGSAYRYARKFTLNLIDCPQPDLLDEKLAPKAGDVYLGIDFVAGIVTPQESLYAEWRSRGIRTYFVVYDLLPILRPDTFLAGSEDVHLAWMGAISRMADGLVCISRAVADEVMQVLDRLQPPRLRSLDIGYFHLGADIAKSSPTIGMGTGAAAAFAQISLRPSFLMVGTVEPRKAHQQALAAFERLWEKGFNLNLVIAGKKGWLVESLAKKLRNHENRGNRLFWLDGCSDEMLVSLYEKCTALLMASEGEGFGLPLIEAAQHKLPIIARDLPVFKEVAGEHAYYFHGTEPADLAHAICEWLELHKSGKVPDSSGMPWLTWKQSTAQLLDVILNGRWYKKWTPQRRS